MKYKLSNYNRIHSFNNEQYLFNARTQALAKLSPEESKQISSKDLSALQADSQFLSQLLYGGFVLQSDMDELELIRFEMQQSRFQSRHLTLTIAPTADCNFRCVYCYEKGTYSHCKMSDETADLLVRFVEGQAQSIQVLSVCWYGGEPLLEMKRITDLSRKFIKICEKNDISYNASMITNGYLLSKKKIEKLNKAKVGMIQVTLDGDKVTHDQRRFLADGQGTYQTIIQNLSENYDQLPHVSLRVNIDKTNVDSLSRIREWIQENHMEEKIHPYAGHVQSIFDTYDSNTCLEIGEYSQIDFGFISEMPNHERLLYPLRLFNCCQADTMLSAVIGCDGSIYRCWDDIGRQDRRTGTLKDGVEANSVFLKYLMQDATQDTECRDCFYLPLCLGGCPHQWQKQKVCSRYKYTLDERIQDFIQSTQTNKPEAE